MEEKSLFIDLMGDSPTIRVMDYLLTERDLDFSITDMAKNSGIGRTTMYRIWDGLLKNNIILPTRVIGKAKLYKLNKESFVIKKLIEIDDRLMIEDLKTRAEDRILSDDDKKAIEETMQQEKEGKLLTMKEVLG
ncbi:TPA: hypothetical protein HA361_02890 [Candidatus Woesearchaeota archaeon]|nr:hypothetical protein [Candidatus Woesearchaeota archaeon]HII68673.1 hypothetical protein [Candidatus Woesearchaeota archaeon]